MPRPRQGLACMLAGALLAGLPLLWGRRRLRRRLLARELVRKLEDRSSQ